LWRSLFKTYDGLVDAEMRVDREEESAGRYRGPPLVDRQSWVKEERDLPLAARYLDTVSRTAWELPPEEANMIANVLAGHSTFGIAFSRKVTHPEAQIVVRNIRDVVKSFEKGLEEEMKEKVEELQNPAIILKIMNEDFGLSLTAADMGTPKTGQLLIGKIREKLKMPEASADELFAAYFSSKMDVRGVIERAVSQIQELFYQPYSTEIVSENKTKLSNHRMNCIVVALQTFYKELTEDAMTCRLLGISEDTDVFDLIDEQLWGYPASTPMTSRARFERLQNLYPEAWD